MWDVQMGGVWAEHIHKSFHRVGLEESYILKEKVVIEVIKDAALSSGLERSGLSRFGIGHNLELKV